MKIKTKANFGFLYQMVSPMSGHFGDDVWLLGEIEIEIELPEDIVALANDLENGPYFNMKPFFEKFVIELPKDFHLMLQKL